MFGGEFDLTSVFGVGIRMLSTFATLQAGDLAKVETSLLTNMVRIVARALRIHAATGDSMNYVDGPVVNVEENETSYDHESFGKLTANDPKFDASDPNLSDVDAVNDTGRWRWLHMRGWLASWIQEWVRDPEKVIGKISDDVNGAGKSRFARLNDGTILMQSVSEIVLERVTRIPVPRRIRNVEDSDGNTADELGRLNAGMLRMWKLPTDPADAFKMAYQIREYARYLSGFLSISRFLQASKDWRVDSEADAAIPDWRSDEADVMSVNSKAPYGYIDTYACYRIMRDGSIVQIAGDGSSFVMAGGDVCISSARHLRLEAAGDITMTAGQDVCIGARRNAELTAGVGGLILKGRAWLKALCELGSVYLKSDAKDPKSKDYVDPTGDIETPKPEVLDSAIVIDASVGGIGLNAARTIAIIVDGPPDNTGDRSDRSASVVIRTKQHVDIDAAVDVGIRARSGSIIATARKQFITKALSVWFDVTSEFRVGNKWFRASSGQVHVNRMHCESVYASSGFHGKAIEHGVPSHAGHIFAIKKDEDLAAIAPKFTDIAELQTALTDFEKVKAFEQFPTATPSWSFIDTESYTHGVSTKHALYESLTAQRIRLDANPVYAAYEAIKLLPAPRTNSSSAPWPGVGVSHHTFSGGDPLHQPSSKKGASLFTQTAMKFTGIIRPYLKLS
jgi:hypothetical protein